MAAHSSREFLVHPDIDRRAKLIKKILKEIDTLKFHIEKLIESKCGLNQRELPDHQRCQGGCSTSQGKIVRCNLQASGGKWCLHHFHICVNVPDLHHDVMRIYDNISSVHFNYLLSVAHTNISDTKYTRLFVNPKEPVDIWDETTFYIWVEFLRKAEIKYILESVPNVGVLIDMLASFYLNAALRYLNIVVCYYGSAKVDRGHYNNMIVSASVASQLMLFMGLNESGPIGNHLRNGLNFPKFLVTVERANGIFRGLNNIGNDIFQLTKLKSLPRGINPVINSSENIQNQDDRTILKLLTRMFLKDQYELELMDLDNEYYREKFKIILANSPIDLLPSDEEKNMSNALYKFTSSLDNVIPKVFAGENQQPFIDVRALLLKIVEYGNNAQIVNEYLRYLEAHPVLMAD